MALTEGDKAICNEMAGELIEKVMERHIASCPHGLLLAKSKSWIIGVSLGVGIGAGVGGGGAFYALLQAAAGS